MHPGLVVAVAVLILLSGSLFWTVLQWTRAQTGRDEALERVQRLEVDLSAAQARLERYSSLHDPEAEATRLSSEAAEVRAELDQLERQLVRESSERAAALEQLDAAVSERRRELEEIEDAVEMQTFGFYKPRFEFDQSEQYRTKMLAVRARQKDLVRGKSAVAVGTTWTVEGSAAKGRAMTNQAVRLMLRAFNGESDVAVAKVRFNNLDRLENRIERAASAINKLNATNNMWLTNEYVQLKVDELHLAHSYQEKKQQEKDDAREWKEQLREEAKAKAEIEKALKSGDREAEQCEKELASAREQHSQAEGDQRERMAVLVDKLEARLAEALDRKAKAIARAQLTKSGWVYVLSNVGSFGEGVYKIGMTRRLEPLDRVRELGDASVPYKFDVHALVFSEDAPALEAALHREFADRKMNLVNTRREFFRVNLDEVRAAFRKHNQGEVTFRTDHEAQEFRQSAAMSRQLFEG